MRTLAIFRRSRSRTARPIAGDNASISKDQKPPDPIAGEVMKSVANSSFGAALVEPSGDKQIGATGMVLAQLLVLQVNDEKGTAVPRIL